MRDYKSEVREMERRERARRVKNIQETLGAIFVGVVFFLLLPIAVGAIETHYTMAGEIVSSKSTGTLVEDVTGNLWEIEDSGYHKGDEVTILFYTNGTDHNRQDDEIVKLFVKKSNKGDN